MRYARLIMVGLTALAGASFSAACRQDQPAGTPPAKSASAPAKAAQPPDSSPATTNPEPSAAESAKPPAGDTQPAPQDPPGLMVRPEVNAAIRDLIAKWDKVQSVSATLKTKGERLTPQHQKQEGKGTRDAMKKDGKLLNRVAYKNGVVMIQPDGEQILTGQRVVRVFDGEFLWVDDTRHEGRRVTKSRPRPGQVQPLGGRPLFAGVRALDKLELLPDATVDGRPVYVFKGTTGGGTINLREYVDKETGILVKLEREDTLAKSTYEVELTNLKVNVDFPDGHFTYTPPEGVEVVDLTRQGATDSPPPLPPE